MSGDDQDIEKALKDVEQAEARVERDEAQLAADQLAEKEAIEHLEEAEHRRRVVIIVDGVEHRERRGPWIVAELKAKLDIDPAKVLAEITPHGLKDLPDDATIELHDGERFMTHARSGGSS